MKILFFPVSLTCISIFANGPIPCGSGDRERNNLTQNHWKEIILSSPHSPPEGVVAGGGELFHFLRVGWADRK